MYHLLYISFYLFITFFSGISKNVSESLKIETGYYVRKDSTITEIFVSVDSPCYSSPETITISHDSKANTTSFKHSGLVVHGQGPEAIYTFSEPTQNTLSNSQYDTLVKLVNNNTKWFINNKGMYTAGCIYTIGVKWVDKKGATINEMVNSYDFKDNSPPPGFYLFITKVSKLCIGSDIIETSHIQFD